MAEPEYRVTMPIEMRAADGSALGLAMIDLLGVIVEQRTGLWCHACSLPSVVELDVNWVRADTLTPHARWRYAECVDCGERDARPRP